LGCFKLEDVQVGSDQILGRGVLGDSVFEALLARTQIVTGAVALGIAQAALEAAAGHSKARIQFSKPLAQMQATRNKIADMAAGISASRLLVYQAADKSATGVPTTAAAMAKVTAAEVAMEAVKEAVQIHGGYGYVKDYTVERLYRDAVFTGIYPTVNEAQRSQIAKAIYRKIS
jgi:alkylation response protein AidB-like acyl-CoA dehydrogenase